ncbi:MAG TPA: ABC transporter ATP-binding protein [Polyangiaceae bacterium]|nr:ABC transporter ATP-binding protein [Polyangiaceae bacterium]
MSIHLIGLTRPRLEPEILDRSVSRYVREHPLLRCLIIYRTMPWRFTITLLAFIVVNGSLTYYQYLIGRAVHELEIGALVTRTAAGGYDYSRALLWAAILGGVALGRSALAYVAGITALATGQELLFRLRDAILAQVQRLDVGYHLRHGIGEMVARTTRDADKVRDALISFWRNVIETGLVIFASLGILFFYDPLLASVPALLTGLGVWLFVGQADRLVALDRAVGDAYDAVSQDLLEGVGGVRVIKSFGLEASRIERFRGAIGRFSRLSLQAIRYAASRVPIPQVLVALGQVWVFGVGCWLVSRGQNNVGELVAAVLAMNTLIFRFEGIGRIIQIFADARSSAARIMDFLDAEPKIRTGHGSLAAGPLGFRLSDVEVRSRDEGGAILQGLSFQVEPGEVVALVGATGSGKSTLAALLPRLLDPTQGRVELGSNEAGWVDVRELELAQVRRQVHVAAQDAFLFSDSIERNLRLAAPGASPAELRRALQDAAAAEIVDELPEGLETRIGDRGTTLSGGQRQRIALARAFLAKPSILVLDDSTSALDAVTEQTILRNLRERAGEGGAAPSLLLIASKPSTVLFADRILVLDGGRIAASGSHAELLLGSTSYRELMGKDDG